MTTESEVGRRRGPVVCAFACAFVTLALDQASKQWALQELDDGRTIPILGRFLGLSLHFNPGAAFSFGTDSTWVFTLVAAAVVLVLPFVILRTRSTPWLVTLGFVWGGAAGNLVDRLARKPGFGRGHVVDFIAYSDWFVGNVADVALVLGVLALAAFSLLGVGEDARRKEGAPLAETAPPGESGAEEPTGIGGRDPSHALGDVSAPDGGRAGKDGADV